jgi:chromosome segregation ATPase
MKNASTAFLVIMLISSLGLWGCSNQKNTAYHHKIRDLETRYGKLEEDYRAVVAANDATRKKLSNLEQQRVELSHQVDELKTAVEEREELKKQLSLRTTERDNVQAQLVGLGRDLQALLGRVEAATASFGNPVVVIPASRKNN